MERPVTKPHRHPLGNRIDPSIYYIYIGPKVDPHFKCIGNRATVIYLGTTLGRMCVILTQQKACGLAEPTDRSSPNEATPPSNLSLSLTPTGAAQIRSLWLRSGLGGVRGLSSSNTKQRPYRETSVGRTKPQASAPARKPPGAACASRAGALYRLGGEICATERASLSNKHGKWSSPSSPQSPLG